MMSCSDNDTESVATNFTEASIIHPGHEYDADRILHEGHYDESTGTEYLVKWSGYDYDRCTWEPAENCDQNLLATWEQTKRSGQDDFDLDAWNDRQLRLTKVRISRRKRRDRKRIRKGLPPWPWAITGAFYEEQHPSKEEAADPEYVTTASDVSESPPPSTLNKRPRLSFDNNEASDDDVPLVRQKRRKSSNDAPSPALTEDKHSPEARDTNIADKLVSFSTSVVKSNLPTLKEHSNPLASLKPALRRGSSLQDASPGSRSSAFPGARRTLAPNIFANDPAASSTVRRAANVRGTSRRGRPGLYTHLAIRHAANKVKEKAPACIPRLTELGTGVAVPAFPDSLASAKEITGRKENMTTRPTSPRPPDSSDSEDGEHGNKTKRSGYLTCWFWARNEYCFNSDSCSFEHSNDYPAAPYENMLMKHQATCYYWATEGRCFRSKDRCAWSHHLTGYVANPTRQPVKLTPEMAERIIQKTEWFSANPENHKLDTKYGCWFHHMTPKGCKKSSETCKFSHGPVDWVAARNNIGGPTWVGQISGKAKQPPPTGAIPHVIREQDEDMGPVDTRSEPNSLSPLPRPTAEAPRTMVLPYAPDQHPILGVQNASTRRQSRDDRSALSVKILFHLFTPPVELAAFLEGLTPTSHSNDIVKMCQEMIFTQLIIKPLLAAQLPSAFLPKMPNDITSEQANKMEAVKGKLIEANAAAILATDAFVMLVFPNSQDWQFLDPGAGRSEAHLRFGIFKALAHQPSRIMSPSKSAATDRGSVLRSMFSAIDLVQLFALSNAGTSQDRRNVFLAFPNSQTDTMEALATLLYQKGADVFHSGTSGSWAQFRQATAASLKSFVVFHSSIETFDTIPGLHELLKFSSVDIFRLLPGKRINYPGGSIGMSPAKMTKLFPRGRVVLVMDECFEAEPEDALEGVEYFAKRASNPEYGKIVGGPNLLDRLLHPHEDTSKGDRDLLCRFWEHFNDIRDKGREEHDGLNLDSEKLNFFCVTEDNLPGYSAKRQSKDPKDKSDASQHLAFWFSMWASSHADQWRRFILVTGAGRKERTELQKLYQHLVVVNPSQYLRLEEAIEKNKALQGRTGDLKRPLLKTAGLAASAADGRSAYGSPVKAAPMAVMGGGSGPPTPVDARLTPRSTPRSPEAVKDAELDAAAETGLVDPRLKMRRENQQRAARK